MSDHTRGMKLAEAYHRFMCAIVHNDPKCVIERLLFDYLPCPDTAVEWEELRIQTLEDATEEAKKYYPHWQGGRRTYILKDSPLGKKLAKGAFKE